MPPPCFTTHDLNNSHLPFYLIVYQIGNDADKEIYVYYR
jgi:hypothetical protein